MYDNSGSDAGREWVEVVNEGGSPVDISGYTFFEGNTNHALTLVSGDATLAPGSAAIIAEDSTKFLADWPNYSGALLKASFSLSNTGETLALKDDAHAQVDQVSYDSSMGASGDGNSLHRSGSTFVAGAPDPGTLASDVPPPVTPASTDTPAAQNTTPSSVSSSSSSSASPSSISARITTDSTVTVGAGSFFTGQAYGTTGDEISNARYVWNFGDGGVAEGQNVFHTYTYPGEYAVMLSAGSNLSSAISKAVVQAAPAQLALMVEADGSAVLVNRSPQDVSVGLWSISSGTSTFVIPEHTTILGNQSVHFSRDILKLFAGADAVLQYPNGTTAVSALPHASSTPTIAAPIISLQQPVKNVISVAPQPKAKTQAIPAPMKKTSVVAADDQPKVQTAAVADAVPLVAATWSLPLAETALALVALLLLGITGVWYAKSSAQGSSPASVEDAFSPDEFEIE